MNIVFCFALILGLQGEVGGERSESRSDGRKSRLFYWFSLQIPAQCERACELQELARSYDRQLEIIGVVRDAGSEGQGGGVLEEFRRSHGLSYPLLTAAEAASDPAVLPALAAPADGPEDYLLLLGPDGHRIDAGTGQKLSQLLRSLAPISTDVDESTWGKIKELFQ